MTDDSDRNDVREIHEENPSPLHYLYESDARQILVDFFLELGTDWDKDDDEPLTKKDIMERTGLSRQAIIDHIEVLETLGVVTSTDGKRWERYYPNVESDAFNALHAANNELYRHWQQRD